MDTDQQYHSKPRQNNMYSLPTRPSGIQHTTCTTYIQHHAPHEHHPKILGLVTVTISSYYIFICLLNMMNPIPI